MQNPVNNWINYQPQLVDAGISEPSIIGWKVWKFCCKFLGSERLLDSREPSIFRKNAHQPAGSDEYTASMYWLRQRDLNKLLVDALKKPTPAIKTYETYEK